MPALLDDSTIDNLLGEGISAFPTETDAITGHVCCNERPQSSLSTGNGRSQSATSNH
jgi:hypothetical protein